MGNEKSKVDATDTVYPTVEANWHNENVRTPGLTKREYFAASAMQGLLSRGIPGPNGSPQNLCEEAVYVADALIAALNKESS